jgi:hypothetical protein
MTRKIVDRRGKCEICGASDVTITTVPFVRLCHFPWLAEYDDPVGYPQGTAIYRLINWCGCHRCHSSWWEIWRKIIELPDRIRGALSAQEFGDPSDENANSVGSWSLAQIDKIMYETTPEIWLTHGAVQQLKDQDVFDWPEELHGMLEVLMPGVKKSNIRLNCAFCSAEKPHSRLDPSVPAMNSMWRTASCTWGGGGDYWPDAPGLRGRCYAILKCEGCNRTKYVEIQSLPEQGMLELRYFAKRARRWEKHPEDHLPEPIEGLWVWLSDMLDGEPSRTEQLLGWAALRMIWEFTCNEKGIEMDQILGARVEKLLGEFKYPNEKLAKQEADEDKVDRTHSVKFANKTIHECREYEIDDLKDALRRTHRWWKHLFACEGKLGDLFDDPWPPEGGFIEATLDV